MTLLFGVKIGFSGEKKSLARRIFGQGSLFTGFYAHQL